MGIKSFLKLVEIQTKLASMIPFLLGTLYAVYHFKRFEVWNFIILFVSILAFDMFTTTLNNYYDYKRANRKHGYNYEKHNAITSHNLKEGTVIAVLAALLIVAVTAGLLLFSNTDFIVLLIGVLSFGTGTCYSFGPVPISRTPLGEAFSGFFMGFMIVFLSAYIHVHDMELVSILFHNSTITVKVDFIEILYIILLSVPTMFGIANIMLANNICDIEDDIENKRYTLPVYIGKNYSLLLFKSLYYISYAAIILMVVLKLVPVINLLALITFIPMNKNVKTFEAKQTKRDTFVVAVKNFMLICGVQVLLFAAGTVLHFY